MKLTVVGSSGSYSQPNNPTSCYLVEDHGFRLVLDLGAGAFGALQTYADPADIDAVMLSHLHPDHAADLAALYVVRRYHPSGRMPRLPVYGPSNSRKFLAHMVGSSDGVDETFEFHEFPYAPIRVGPYKVSTVEAKHPGDSYSIRLESDGGSSLTYSGDTGWNPGLADLASRSNIALFEASFLDGSDNPADVHLTARQACQLAQQADVEQLVLTHFVAWNNLEHTKMEAETEYDGTVHYATPGAVFFG